jgi:N-glycosylase/DNA lyase
MVKQEWPVFPLCSTSDVNLDVCLDMGGQSFTWQRLSEHRWLNVIVGHPVAIIRSADKVLFSIQDPSNESIIRSALEDYLRLGDDLKSFYKQWSADKHFLNMSKGYPGIRLLRQDPVETLFAFICSQNNAIPRITKMVQHLKTNYGPLLGEYEGHEVHGFPPLAKLARAEVEGELRAASFGYRAKYIQKAARHLLDTGMDLLSLRSEPYETVHETLLEVPGVGPKVADCIALMSLDQLGAVPIDTHIWQVACKHYRFPGIPQLNGKTKASLTKNVYKALGEGFRNVFGPKAGWAHLILFAAQQRK